MLVALTPVPESLCFALLAMAEVVETEILVLAIEKETLPHAVDLCEAEVGAGDLFSDQSYQRGMATKVEVALLPLPPLQSLRLQQLFWRSGSRLETEVPPNLQYAG